MTVATPEQLRTFVGPRADYYLKRWQRLEASKAPGFNWAAFFFGPYWLLYRRMFRTFWISLAVIGGITVLLVLATKGDPPRILDAFIAIATTIFFGRFGTYLYYLHTRRKIALLSLAGEPDSQRLTRAGGVGWLGVLIFLLANLVVFMPLEMALR